MQMTLLLLLLTMTTVVLYSILCSDLIVLFPFLSLGAVRVQLHHHQEPDQHRGHPWPQTRKHIRFPGPGSNRGRVRSLQRETVLSDHD